MQDNHPPHPPQPPQPSAVGIAILEYEEFAFAHTSARFAKVHGATEKDAADHIRSALRLHRFIVFAWLLQNGVKVPVHLMDDRVHRDVGQQSPDKTT